MRSLLLGLDPTGSPQVPILMPWVLLYVFLASLWTSGPTRCHKECFCDHRVRHLILRLPPELTRWMHTKRHWECSRVRQFLLLLLSNMVVGFRVNCVLTSTEGLLFE